ncbi:MAG: alanine racemase, partial [bacterium]
MNLAQPDVWVEIDLSSLRHNASAIKQSLPTNVALMAIVKGNGFGHGYVEPAKAFVAAGAAMLGVTRLGEALELRNGGVTAPILLLAPIQADNAAIAIENDLICAVDSLPLATSLSEAAAGTGAKAKIHIK